MRSNRDRDPKTAALARGTAEAQAISTRRVAVLEGHAFWAETYDHQPNPLLALEARKLEPLLPDLKGKFVLDLACGTGRWLNYFLARQARRALGVDLSSEMILRAASKSPLRGRLIRADCLALPISDAVADVAVCSFAAGYVHELPTLARELQRVLRRPGDAFITDFHPSALGRGWKRTFRHAGEVLEISSTSFSLEQLCRWFAAEGFELVQCLEPSFGEPERHLFEEAGKTRLFETACLAPAIFICHFKLTAAPSARRTTS